MTAEKKKPAPKKPAPKKPRLNVKVAFEGQPDDGVQVRAYAFDRSGRFLDSAAVDDLKATLAIDAAQARRTRLFFGPPLPEGSEEQAPTLEMMERLQAYEAVWRFEPDRRVHEIAPFPEYHWKCWPLCRCRVRGRVVRPVEVNGVTRDLPVCHARVHICEVDRIWRLILRLPEKEIFRLRDEFLYELERPFPRPPLPDPPFRFDPGVIDPSPENVARMVQASGIGPGSGSEEVGFNPLPEPPAVTLAADSFSARALGPQPEPPDLEIRAEGQSLQRISADSPQLKTALSSNSVTVVREALVANYRILVPYLCLWPWFFYWLRCDEVAVVQTDGQGRFDAEFTYLCCDTPDLYFWIEAFIEGSWTTVYRPPLACNTWWNFACGSEVTLRVTDPRVPVCDEPPDLAGLQVAVMSIGNNVSISEIDGGTANPTATHRGRPFGGRLEPHVWFSRGALIAAGITHYKWSYRRLTGPDGVTAIVPADTWHDMNRRVIRHYAQIEQTPPDYPLSFPAYPLGPDPAFGAQNLFQIQPVNVPVVPPAGSTIEGWASWIDAREDLASAFFQSHLLEGSDPLAAAGKYELKLELFDNTGARVNLTDRGVLLKEADQPAPFGSGTVVTKLAPPSHRVLDGSGKTVGFRITLWVDNNPCQAYIYTVGGPGLTVNTPCGFIRYLPGANARIRFLARHPNNFATFRFQTHRGPSILVSSASAVGRVGDNPVNGFVRDAASVFSKWLPVTTLLTENKPAATPDCTEAAFAETLYVWARATDGWSRLHYLDARGTPKAFALAPAGP